MKENKSEKAITLIALVITIIVLLILATVSISVLMGKNGLLTKANEAKKEHQIDQYKEEVNLIITEEIMERKIEPKQGIPLIKSLEEKINQKEWVKQTYLCNQDGIQESEIQKNNYLEIIAKEEYKIVVEVKNEENQAWIVDKNEITEEQVELRINSNIEELNKLTKLEVSVTTLKASIENIEVSIDNQIFHTKTMKQENTWKETISFEDFMDKLDFEKLNFNENIEIKITAIKTSGEKVIQTKILKNYIISKANDLKILADEVNNGRNFYQGKTISQVKDIDLQGSSSNPTTTIGKNTNFAFEGIYDGDMGQTPCYRKIKNIYIDSSDTYQGLFAYNKGTIRNIGIEGGTIRINEKAEIPIINGTKGGINVGGIAGLNYSDAVIENCYNTATIISDANIKDNNDAGGIAGWNAGIIRNCYNKGNISNHVGISGGIVGGLGSIGDKKGEIEYCYNTAIIHGNIAGGLVGVLSIGCHSNFSYTIGNVTGNTKGLFYGVFKGAAYNCFRISYDGISGSGITENNAVAIISTGNNKDAIQTEDSMKTDIILDLLGGSSHWKKDSENRNNGYFQLSWE